MQVLINGVDIATDLDSRIKECLYEEYAGVYNNTMTIVFVDEDTLWSDWDPTSDDTIQVKEETQDSGTLFIHQTIHQNGLFSLIARSMPKARNGTRYKKWEKVTFSEVGNEVASNLGLTFENHGVNDEFYDEMIQKHESDLSFFEKLCMYESASMLIYDEKLVAYDEATLESQDADADIQLGIDGRYRFVTDDPSQYGSCTVYWLEKPPAEDERFIAFISRDGHYYLRSGEYVPAAEEQELPGKPEEEITHFEFEQEDDKDEKGGEYYQDHWYRPIFDPEKVEYTGTATADAENTSELYIDYIRVLSDAQALRWAGGILKNKNKYRVSGWFCQKLNTDLSAGMLIQLKVDKSPKLNGKYFIYKVEHDFKANSTKCYVRKI